MQVTLKYLNTQSYNGFSGRGGAVRFYMLLHNIQFDEVVVSFDEWGSVKADVMKSGESPAGHLPIVYVDGEPLTETLAILRRFSKLAGEYGNDIDRDYMVDRVADAAAEFRTALVSAVFGSAEEKQSYLTALDKRSHYYAMLTTFLDKAKASGPHVVGDLPSFADSLVFGILWDDVAIHGKEGSPWDTNPKVVNFYDEFLKQAAVSNWCKGVRPELVP